MALVYLGRRAFFSRKLPIFHLRTISNKVKSEAMKAIRVHVFGGPEKLQFEDDVIIPECNAGQVLIRVAAAGINPVDTYIRSGTYSRVPKLPYIPGMDGAGVVEEVGDDVKKFKNGDRVFFSRKVEGSYAEFCIAPEDSCWPLPNSLTFEQGAAIGAPYFTVYHALFQRAHPKPGQSLLIHGASGAVGLAACQVGKTFGLKVFGTAGTEEGLKLVKENGASETFNHRDKGYLEKILIATGGEGVDIILENLANVNLGHDLELLKMNGIVLVVGSRGQVKIDPRDLMGKESGIAGVALMKSTESQWEETTRAICDGIQKGHYKPVVDKAYPLNEAAQAHKDIINSKGAKGKLVLKIAEI